MMTRGIDISFWNLFGCLVLLTVAACLLGGCVTTGTLSSNTPVCHALVGPIKYNSTVKTSRRYAGPDLAPDLNQRNQVGRNLHCPLYR